MISQEVIQSILGRYTLPWEGIHGLPHWARVLENGRRLSEATGARRDIVELFAGFHDSQRINEATDDGHGRRGSELARDLRCVAYELDDEAFSLLIQACDLHTEGYLDGDVTLRDVLGCGPPRSWKGGNYSAGGETLYRRGQGSGSAQMGRQAERRSLCSQALFQKSGASGCQDVDFFCLNVTFLGKHFAPAGKPWPP